MFKIGDRVQMLADSPIGVYKANDVGTVVNTALHGIPSALDVDFGPNHPMRWEAGAVWAVSAHNVVLVPEAADEILDGGDDES